MLTEDEALKKWCPAYRAFTDYNGHGDPCVSDNRPYDESHGSGNAGYCIGSTCMAWRWLREIDPDSPPDMLTYRDTDRGYCGLGGHPQ